MNLQNLGGLKIIQSPFCLVNEQFRFPRSRKRRIRRKWAERQENYRVVPSMYYSRIHDAIICHPFLVEKMRQGGA